MSIYRTSPLLALAALLVGCSSQTLPGNSGNAITLASANRVVARISDHRLQAEKLFHGPGGLIGIVITRVHKSTVRAIPNQRVVWMTRDGKVLLPEAYSPSGQNLNARYMKKMNLLPKLKPLKPLPTMYHEALYDKSGIQAFTVGQYGPILVAVVDPNCIFCHRFYEHVMPEVHAGRLRVRFVVTGFLKPSSQPKAETILSAANPAKALAYDETHFDVASA